MRGSFKETRRQLAGIRRFWSAMLDMPAMTVLLVAGVITAMAWKGGFLILLVEALPGWAQMLVAMPLLGSMLAVYALGGLATVSLALSIATDIALAPVREFRSGA